MNESKRKALFFDVDGTLVASGGAVPSSAAEAIREARRNGHLVFINSGRCLCMLGGIQNQVENDGLLAGCGTEILIGGKRVRYYSVPRECTKRLIAAGDRYGVDIVLEGSRAVWYPEHIRFIPTEEVERLARDSGAHVLTTFSDGDEISKFCIQTDDNSDMEGLTAEFGGDFDIADRHNHFYECVPKGYSKGSALLDTLAYFHIDTDDAYCFGDSVNDLPMFRTKAHTIAMRRHDPELDSYTEYVTDDVQSDGIRKALLHIGVI